MANWKVIAPVSGNMKLFQGPAAQDRPRIQECTVWEGPATDKAEALKSAEKADSRVDLKWTRITYERDPEDEVGFCLAPYSPLLPGFLAKNENREPPPPVPRFLCSLFLPWQRPRGVRPNNSLRQFEAGKPIEFGPIVTCKINNLTQARVLFQNLNYPAPTVGIA
jgi:hypothetical protein